MVFAAALKTLWLCPSLHKCSCTCGWLEEICPGCRGTSRVGQHKNLRLGWGWYQPQSSWVLLGLQGWFAVTSHAPRGSTQHSVWPPALSLPLASKHEVWWRDVMGDIDGKLPSTTAGLLIEQLLIFAIIETALTLRASFTSVPYLMFFFPAYRQTPCKTTCLLKAKLGVLCIHQHALCGKVSLLQSCGDSILTLMMDYWWVHSDKMPRQGQTPHVKLAETVVLSRCWWLHAHSNRSPFLPLFSNSHHSIGSFLIFPPVLLLTPNHIYLHNLSFPSLLVESHTPDIFFIQYPQATFRCLINKITVSLKIYN